MTDWKNRITGYEVVDPRNLKANPRNWRRHPEDQKRAMRAVLGDLGWVGPLIVNANTGHIIDGHERQEEAIANAEKGVPVLWVDLSQDEENLALATFDPLTALAQGDPELYEDLLEQLDAQAPELEQLLSGTRSAIKEAAARARAEQDSAYTRKIKPPIYEPTGAKPRPIDLYDESRTQQLLADIRDADLPDDVRAFLVSAARRHTQFHFGRVAEFYAHAPAEIQRLMEDSALVIIDFDRAIEQGFVNLVDQALEQYREKSEDA